jgi:hypothetical protein
MALQPGLYVATQIINSPGKATVIEHPAAQVQADPDRQRGDAGEQATQEERMEAPEISVGLREQVDPQQAQR